MKKIIKFLLCFVLVFTILSPITAFAAEVSASEEEITGNDIFSRVWEFVEANKSEVVSAAGSALLLIAGAISKAGNSKENKKLGEQLNIIQGDTQGTTKAQSSIIDVVNQMIIGYNEMKESNGYLKNGYEDMKSAYEINALKEDDRNRLIGAVMVQNTALLEILSSVYVHNKNLPQGVKDLVVLKYANVQKALSDDELLIAIVESVREKVNFEEIIEAAPEIDEESDVIGEFEAAEE